MRLKTLLPIALLGAYGCVPFESELSLPPAATIGPAPAAPGLAEGCSETARTVGRMLGRVYTLPTTTRRLPDFELLQPSGAVCLDEIDVSERRGYPSFPGIRDRYTWFGVDLHGAFAVSEPGTYEFRLTSDDGAKLVIDGAPVIDNDGYHATRASAGAAQLGAGVHTIDVPYWQGPGPLAIVLEVSRPGGPFQVFHVDRPLGT